MKERLWSEVMAPLRRSWDDNCGLCEEQQARLRELADRGAMDGFILFRNMTLGAMASGQTTAVLYGPTCTYKRPEDVEGQWLYDLPSQRQYPVYFTRRPTE